MVGYCDAHRENHLYPPKNRPTRFRFLAGIDTYQTSGSISKYISTHPKAAIGLILNGYQMGVRGFEKPILDLGFENIIEAVNSNNDGSTIAFFLRGRRVPKENIPVLPSSKPKGVYACTTAVPYCCGAGFGYFDKRYPDIIYQPYDPMSLFFLSREEYLEHGSSLAAGDFSLAAAFYSEHDEETYLLHKSLTDYIPVEYDEDEGYW